MICARWAWVVLGLLLPSFALAVTGHEAEHHYRYDQVWGSAVRLIRVDMGFPIREKDQDIGYVVFDYVDSTGEKTPGSIEVLAPREGRREGIRVVVKTPQQPGYVEIRILDKLKKKLYEEHGEPREAAPPPPKDEAPRKDPESDERQPDKNEDKAKSSDR